MMSSEFSINEIFSLKNDETNYRKLDTANLGVDTFRGEKFW